MKQEKIFKCWTKYCKDGCEEAPGWCDICIEIGPEKSEAVAKIRFGTESAPPVSEPKDPG